MAQLAQTNFKKGARSDWAARVQTLYEWASGQMPTPPQARSGLGQLLWKDPAPLIDPRHKLVVIFSPKAACTNVLIWFLHHLGHAKAARDFHIWPHEYRTRVYYQSVRYLNALERDLSSFTVIRVVRDPYERAASSFRHLLRQAKEGLAAEIGLKSVKSGLSFSDFLGLLERMDLTNCDSHFSLQRHPVEDVLRPHYVINVSTEDLFERLADIENDLGLAQTDLRNDEWVQKLSGRHQPERELTGDDLVDRRLTVENAQRGPWPRPELLLTRSARDRIARLYAADINSYLSGSSASLETQP